MPVVFLSHSSTDDEVATAIGKWLAGRGFTDVFIDHDKLAAGDRWREALRSSIGACRVVICLVSRAWLQSDECFAEFRSAWYGGKRIIPLYLLREDAVLDQEADRRLASLCAEDHGLDLQPCIGDDGLLNLDLEPRVAELLDAGLCAAGAKTRVGVEPEAFRIDRSRRPTPFPGLGSFGDEDADAALFYGRSRETFEVLEWLREMRAKGDRRPLFILGASGAGKSSLLKAGVVPRLRRERPAWLPLRVFRPGADPLFNFADAVARTLADYQKRKSPQAIREELAQSWSQSRLISAADGRLMQTFTALGEELLMAAGLPSATILIGVDQAEELAHADDDSAEILAALLRTASMSVGVSWQVALTVRTDSFAELQTHRHFQGLEGRGYDLRAVPVFRFSSVIEAPARRYGVDVRQDLIDRLIADAPDADALPLLAFMLQRLWDRFAATGELNEANYSRVGGLKGLMEDAAERALAGIDPAHDVPRPSGRTLEAVDELGATTFVPALVQLNERGAMIRRMAPWASFDARAQTLIRQFTRWRLVVHRGIDSADSTVEVAHEALFREWGRLAGWLEPERARLETLRALQADSAAWERSERDSSYLNHRGRRLTAARRLERLKPYRVRMQASEVEYLAACASAQRAIVAKRLLSQSLALLAIVGVAGMGYAGWLNPSHLKIRFDMISDMMQSKVLTAEAERNLHPKAAFQECAYCPEMVVVPPGWFMMGSDKGKGDDDELPRHRVDISKPFAVSRFEITFDNWEACVTFGGCDRDPGDQGWGKGRRPVINVSWGDAQQYVRWLSKFTSKQYRLLSESEWEYVARAGSQAKYSWGDDIGKGRASCDGCGGSDENIRTQPVGSFPANTFGLHDLHGNVWEWVEDPWHNNYIGAPSNESAWIEGGDAVKKVARGGSWTEAPRDLQSANRVGFPRDHRKDDMGFRIAREIQR